MWYRRSLLEPARACRAALAATLAVTLGGCMPDRNGPGGDDLTGLAGVYEMTRANGADLPAAVSTSWIEGTVTEGSLRISSELEYWLSFRVAPVGGGEPRQFDLHGVITGATAAAQIILFLDDRGVIDFQGIYGGVMIEVPTLKEMTTTRFRWVAPLIQPA
jgi:hypothetical protein